MILVSACLCGENCKYSGGNNKNKGVLNFLKEKSYIKVCPEELGGLTTPRNPAEIIGCASEVLNNNDKIVDNNGKDVSGEFIRGAFETLRIANENDANMAILKANSPSCGKGIIYDGSFNGIKISGNGITSELLIQNGISVFTEDEI